MLVGCDRYYQANILVDNNTTKGITVSYQIKNDSRHSSDSIYTVRIKPNNKAIIYDKPESLGIKCEDYKNRTR